MWRINKKMEYGIMALLYLQAKPDHMASVHEMAQHHHIPEPLLSKVMQRLKAKNFVTSVYGHQGGYRLAQQLSEINLFDLSQTIVGPVQIAACLDPAPKKCAAHAGCTIVSPMNSLNQKVIHLFRNITLESLGKEEPLVHTTPRVTSENMNLGSAK